MEYNNSIKGKKDHEGKFIPFRELSLDENVQKELLLRFKTAEYQSPIDLTYGISAEFFDAGHIPGSSQILYNIDNTRVLMCFDLGRSLVQTPIVNQPTKLHGKQVDYVFVESTYGKRWHDKHDNTSKQLEKIIHTASKKKQRVICGAFSIMRTQLVLYDLFKLHKEKKIPDDFKIYLDSPTALEINKIVKNHPELYNEKAKKDFADPNYNPFNFPNLTVVTGARGSRGLHKISGAHMIVSASCMFDMGRIKRHVHNNIENRKTVFLITGYQAQDSLGRILKEGRNVHPRVTIDVDSFDPSTKVFSATPTEFDFKAQVKEIKGYSGHSDALEIADHLTHINNPKFGQQFKGIFIVHGDYESNLALEDYLKKRGFQNTIIPKLGREYELK